MVKFNLKKKVAKALVFAMVMGTVGVHGMSLKSPVAVMAAVAVSGNVVTSSSTKTTLTFTRDGNDIIATYVATDGDTTGFLYKIGDGNWGSSPITETTKIPHDGTAVTIQVTESTDTTYANAQDVALAAVQNSNTTSAVTAPTLIVAHDSFTATITGNNSENYLFLEVLKDEKGDKVSNTYCFNGSPVTVDLSFLKVSKVSYLRAYGDKDMKVKSEIVPVGAQPKKVSIKYVAGAESVEKSFLIDKKEATAAELGKYSIRTLLGWASSEQNDVNMFVTATDLTDPTTYTTKSDKLDLLKITGTTLIFSKNPVENEVNDGKVVEIGSARGPEIKVKVAAIPKAPKVTVDYIKGTVKLSKGTAYSIVGAMKKDENGEDTSEQNWVPCADGKSLTPIEMIIAAKGYQGTDAESNAKEDFANGVTLMVRTAAVSGKKDASQITFTEIIAADSIAKTTETGKNQIDVADGREDGASATKYLSYSNDGSGLVLKANGVAFDYSLDEGKKWKTIKEGSQVTLKNVNKVTVRTTPVKPNAKSNIEGAFASNTVLVELLATPDKPKYNANTHVLTASETTLTFKANETTKKYAMELEGNDVVLEYYAGAEIGESTVWTVVVGRETIDAETTAGAKVWVRIAAVKDVSYASEEVEITLAQITAAEEEEEAE